MTLVRDMITTPNMDTVVLSGQSDAKGRNGYYKLAEVQLWETQYDEPEKNRVMVEFLGKRGVASARLELTIEDWKTLIEALGKYI